MPDQLSVIGINNPQYKLPLQGRIEELARKVQINIALRRFDVALDYMKQAEHMHKNPKKYKEENADDVPVSDLHISEAVKVADVLVKYGITTVGDVRATANQWNVEYKHGIASKVTFGNERISKIGARVLKSLFRACDVPHQHLVLAEE